MSLNQVKILGSELLASSLYLRFKASVDDVKEFGFLLPKDVLRDVEFFILNPDISPSLKTNTDLAYRLGQLSNECSTVVLYELSKAIHELFLARDKMIKGFLVENVLCHLKRCETRLAYLKAEDNVAFELTRQTKP